MFGVPYEAGSLIDKLIEGVGGPHDYLGGQISGLYDEKRNATREMTEVKRTTYNSWSAIALAPADPFAAATLLPPEVGKAISIMFGATK